jgi:NAD(P)-dependent dehydrogenase (short-subunit alcohol dehydrogenase family)
MNQSSKKAELQHFSRIALVTGSGSGIGRRIAEYLALEGAVVCVVDRDEKAAEDTVRDIRAKGGRAEAFVVDLSNPADIPPMLETVDSQEGPPDIVVNCAGIAATVPALEVSLEQWQLTMAVNVTAPFMIQQHVLRSMQARGWGRIVNVASISGVRAGTGRLSYGTSKAALIAMTKQFAIESAEYGVTVNAIAPGPVLTPLVQKLHGGDTVETYSNMVPMRRYGTTDEMAHVVAFLASEGASYVTGETLAVDGGFLASGLLVRNLFTAVQET